MEINRRRAFPTRCRAINRQAEVGISHRVEEAISLRAAELKAVRRVGRHRAKKQTRAISPRVVPQTQAQEINRRAEVVVPDSKR